MYGEIEFILTPQNSLKINKKENKSVSGWNVDICVCVCVVFVRNIRTTKLNGVRKCTFLSITFFWRHAISPSNILFKVQWRV